MTPAPSGERTTRRRRRGRALLVGAAALAALLAIALVVLPPLLAHQEAEARYADAVSARNAAGDEYAHAHATFQEVAAPAGELLDVADGIAIDTVRPYVGADAFDTVADRADAVRDLREELPDVVDPPTAQAAEEFDTADEYLAKAEELEDQAEGLSVDAGALTKTADAYVERVPALERALADLRANIPDEAARIEEENVSALALTRIQMRRAAELAATSRDGVASAVREYAAAARAVEESQEAELSEKRIGDGLFETRLEVEDFVRSIVGDTRVDFDWAPIVNGLGQGESAGGYTTWWYSDGGYATMEFSHSIAAYWPDERFQGLVVHEAGHAITSQCQDMLVETFDGDVELMATAWAIGRGYDNPWGNGVDYYYGGVPPAPDLVEASKECR
ncbi:hypothetical protein [Microbacterium suaedae]|uniref:hypothetical protein n=1 Tax=Microbacterium suaedae TaxID=2067813 RepID=UPI000DA18731|nr:hypothetical protein [Microbacterium suaedae]